MNYKADVTIVGAGVVGLAIAAEIARPDLGIYVLEKNGTYGAETSSHNSQVIHSGIHYPEGTLKALHCVRGNKMLYEICQTCLIEHKKIGKLTVATNDQEMESLKRLMKLGLSNGVPDLRILDERELHELEPRILGQAALLSPSTGIIDVFSLMRSFQTRAREQGAQIVYRTQVVGIEKTSGGMIISVNNGVEPFSFKTRVLVNSAGLFADKIARLAGIDVDEAGYRLHYCKGDYFQVSGPHAKWASRLIYPVPKPAGGGLGIHVTLDTENRMRLGPSDYFVERLDYAVDSSLKEAFCESARRLLPFIEPDDLEPDMAGIRPKLQGPNGCFRDFVIQDERDKGLPGLINLVGIESPGLTSSPSIARYVKSLVQRYLA